MAQHSISLIAAVRRQAAPVVPPALATSFSDSFTRADTTYNLGADWIYRGDWTTTYRILTNRLRIQQAGPTWPTPGSNYSHAIPAAPGLNGLSQFAESKIVSVSGNVRAGLCVMTGDIGGVNGAGLQGSFIDGYYLQSFCELTKFQLCRARSWGYASSEWLLVDNLTMGFNEVWRLSLVVQASQNVITVHRAGALVATYNDNAADRPTAGMPGYFTRFVPVSGNQVWDDFACGPAV